MKLMKRLIGENLRWKVVSLAMAVVLWYAVAGEPSYETSIAAPLELSNFPAELEISSEKPDVVSLQVRGPSGQLERSQTRGVAVVLDLAPIQSPCERTFTLTSANVRLPTEVQFVRAVPSQIRLRFERRVVREVPVQVRFSGTPGGGYNVRSYTVEPAKLRITGPESHVDQVSYAETDEIDLAGVMGERVFRTNVFVDDPQVRFESVPEVAVKVLTARTGPAEDR